MSNQVFILKTDTIQGYDGDILWFPSPLIVTTYARNGIEAINKAYEELRAKARRIGANAVLSVHHPDYAEWLDNKGGYRIRAVGQPVYLDPPLPDPYEILKGLGERL